MIRVLVDHAVAVVSRTLRRVFSATYAMSPTANARNIVFPVAVVVLLAVAGVAHAEPPCPLSAARVAGFDWFAVPAGCPAPIAGALYTMRAHEQVGAEIAGLEALVIARTKRLAGERAAHARTRAWCAEELDIGSAVLSEVSDPPSRLVWAGVGAGGAVVAGVVALLLVR